MSWILEFQSTVSFSTEYLLVLLASGPEEQFCLYEAGLSIRSVLYVPVFSDWSPLVCSYCLRSNFKNQNH